MRTERTMNTMAIPVVTGRMAGWVSALVLALAILPGAPIAAQQPAAADSATQDRVITGDHTIEEGEVVSDIAVVGGDLTVRGEVTGAAVVVGGNLILPATGIIRGDATVTGGSIVQDGGLIGGEMKATDGAAAPVSASTPAAEARAAVREARRSAEMAGHADMERLEARMERQMESRRRESSWFDPIRRGFAGLISTLAFGLMLAGVGALLVFYGRPYLETVSDTLRASTMRSGAVGLAAGFLVVPAFVVMVVALAVSIIGIPVLILAAPLYPLAVVAAAALGLLGAAHAIGERTAEQQGGSFVRGRTNSYSYLFTGIAMILTPLVIASFLDMTGFLDFLGTILRVVTWAVIWAITTAGFGAVILSRAGTRRAFVSTPPEPMLDDEALFDDEPSTRGPHA